MAVEVKVAMIAAVEVGVAFGNGSLSGSGSGRLSGSGSESGNDRGSGSSGVRWLTPSPIKQPDLLTSQEEQQQFP